MQSCNYACGLLLAVVCWQHPDHVWLALLQAETNRQLAAVTAAESDALAAALSRKMQVQEASNKEVQRLREESAELRE
jgi:hypothetical protein